MNLDDLKPDWQERHNMLAGEQYEFLVAKAASRIVWFETTILRRDMIEAIVGVAVVMFFILFPWFVDTPPTMQVGLGICILGILIALGVMHWGRHADAWPKHDLPLRDFCLAEIVRVDRQIFLLRNITWWYSGPILLGCCVVFYGALNLEPTLPRLTYYGFMAAFLVCFIAMGYIIHRINSQAVQTELLPLREELSSVVLSLEDSSEEEIK